MSEKILFLDVVGRRRRHRHRIREIERDLPPTYDEAIRNPPGWYSDVVSVTVIYYMCERLKDIGQVFSHMLHIPEVFSLSLFLDGFIPLGKFLVFFFEP